MLEAPEEGGGAGPGGGGGAPEAAGMAGAPTPFMLPPAPLKMLSILSVISFCIALLSSALVVLADFSEAKDGDFMKLDWDTSVKGKQ